jgi:MFS transporter, Spinster family, sphingosine-1-phosphate transporter
MPSHQRYRWFVVALFFIFMLLHQADKLLIGPMTTDIMETFKITRSQMGAVSTGALIVGGLFYPLWGYLYDRFARSKLLALAAFLWGSTTWLNALAPNYGTFLITRSSTGIDDSSYPGLYSLVTDYFLPKLRGKIYGLLQLTGPLGYLIGMILGILLSGSIGWRGVFYLTGSLGILLAIVMFLTLKEPPRGQSEPELVNLDQVTRYRFEWRKVVQALKKPTLVLLFIQGFFGVFPWNAITYWFFNYLETERGYTEGEVLVTMVIAVLVLAAGYPLGGALGDHFFQKTPRGRVYVAASGVLAGAILFWITLSIPHQQKLAFMLMMAITALAIPLAAPNVTSIVYDVTLPEVRSTALAIENFIESSGAALSPLLIGLIADRSSLGNAFLIICVSAWLLCAVFFALIGGLISRDMQDLRQEMRLRAGEKASA